MKISMNKTVYELKKVGIACFSTGLTSNKAALDSITAKENREDILSLTSEFERGKTFLVC